MERHLNAITVGIRDSGITRLALQTGLALNLRPQWRGIGITVGIGWVILMFFHAAKPHPTEPTIYTGVTLLTAVWLFTKLNSVLEAWKNRGPEETLLVLTPRWPASGQVKSLFLQTILESQLGTWVTWLLITVPFYWAGWIDQTAFSAYILIMLTAATAGSSSLLLALSRRSFREVNWATIALVLFSAGGAAVYLFGDAVMQYPRLLGGLMILGPLGVGILCFAVRPLQLPVRKISKQ